MEPFAEAVGIVVASGPLRIPCPSLTAIGRPHLFLLQKTFHRKNTIPVCVEFVTKGEIENANHAYS